jgi:phenylalanine-4-hydroxylase
MRIKPTVQDYRNYTTEDFEVWALLFSRQMEHLQQHASRLYLEAIGQIGFRQDEIPDFAATNSRLLAATGWQLTVARELVPQAEFFSLLARRIFPATCWLRTMAELDYLEEPDMFHDVFGHAPLLMHPDYAAFMEAFGKLALQWLHDPAALKLLSAVYWFTVEFGLLTEQGMPRIFGAGIISSVGESLHASGPGSEKLTFDIHRMMHTAYRTDVVQDRYFVIDSFEQLLHALPHIAALLGSVSRSVLQVPRKIGEVC